MAIKWLNYILFFSLFFIGNLVADPSSQNAPASVKTDKLTPTQTILSISPSGQSMFGEQVRFVAKVVPTYIIEGVPTGSVQFLLDNKPLANQPIVNNYATYTTSSLPVSSEMPHHLSAVYSGDQTYALSRDLLNYFVLPINTEVRISSSGNRPIWGEPILLKFDVDALTSAKMIPQGSIQVQIDEEIVQTIPLDAKGQASYSTSSLEVGNRVVTASFLGNESFNPSYSTISQFVGKASTTTTLASTPNPSGYLSPVTFTAAVTSPQATPSGMIGFSVDGAAVSKQSLDASGSASYTLSNLDPGRHTVSAVYLGSSNFKESSARVMQEVTQAVKEMDTAPSDIPEQKEEEKQKETPP